MIPIIHKEMRTYFTSMSGYVFLSFLVLLTGIIFTIINVYSLSPNYQSVLASSSMMFLILIPVLTMRLFAEEARQKTDQLLYTSPLSIPQIVIGKYMAALALFLIGMAVTALFPVMISGYGELPVPQIAGAFLGYILMGACFISVGLFISALTENQIIAAVVTFAILFIFYIMEGVAGAMPTDRVSSIAFLGVLFVALGFIVYDSTKNIYAGIIAGAICAAASLIAFLVNNFIFDGVMVKILLWFSLLSRYSNFSKGVLNVADVVYYITFSVAFIYLTINVIEKRRWK